MLVTAPARSALSLTARRWLLARAREAIAAQLSGEALPPGAAPDECLAPGSCFVTLRTRDGELRGCIGTLGASGALARAVEEMAAAAAVSDPRFPPLTADELDECTIEISALTPPVVASPSEVIAGEHGVVVRRGARRGVLLPQVATEHGWDSATLLDHTCLKAGLDRRAWREDPGVEVEVFRAEVFRE